MSKPNTPNTEASRVDALEAELRLMREQHSAELQALRDDLLHARSIAAGASPDDQTRKLVEFFDRAAHADRMAKKTAEYFDAVDARSREFWRNYLAGDKMYLVVLESGPMDNSTGAIAIQKMSPRFVGVTSPDNNPKVLEELALARFCEMCGVCARPPFFFILPVSDEYAAQVREAFGDSIGAANNNSLIELSVELAGPLVADYIAAAKAKIPEHRRVDMPASRFEVGDMRAHSSSQPLLPLGTSY